MLQAQGTILPVFPSLFTLYTKKKVNCHSHNKPSSCKSNRSSRRDKVSSIQPLFLLSKSIPDDAFYLGLFFSRSMHKKMFP